MLLWIQVKKSIEVSMMNKQHYVIVGFEQCVLVSKRLRNFTQ